MLTVFLVLALVGGMALSLYALIPLRDWHRAASRPRPDKTAVLEEWDKWTLALMMGLPLTLMGLVGLLSF